MARSGFDAAVAATILGIFVSGTLWYIDHEQELRTLDGEALRQRQLQAIETGRYRQDLVLKLQAQLLEHKTPEDLQRLASSLELIEVSRTDETHEIITSFRRKNLY